MKVGELSRLCAVGIGLRALLCATHGPFKVSVPDGGNWCLSPVETCRGAQEKVGDPRTPVCRPLPTYYQREIENAFSSNLLLSGAKWGPVANKIQERQGLQTSKLSAGQTLQGYHDRWSMSGWRLLTAGCGGVSDKYLLPLSKGINTVRYSGDGAPLGMRLLEHPCLLKKCWHEVSGQGA